jgi:NDP-sugar pyrophosphorylase family protein
MKAVILAGGKGTRLKPYTAVFPKPLVPIGYIPILEVVIRQLRSHGFTEVIMAVGHLAELLMAYFGDGSRFGLHINYSREEIPLGTVGPLAQIADLSDTFLVMNGDVLTTLNYRELLMHHRRSGAQATIATHERSVKIDFGVVESNAQEDLTNYVEKPSFHYRVSMGVYVFEPAILSLIAPGQRLDFPDLVHLLLQSGRKVVSYPYDGYWLDIGRPDDYEQASEEFTRLRHQFLPEPCALSDTSETHPSLPVRPSVDGLQ